MKQAVTTLFRVICSPAELRSHGGANAVAVGAQRPRGSHGAPSCQGRIGTVYERKGYPDILSLQDACPEKTDPKREDDRKFK